MGLMGDRMSGDLRSSMDTDMYGEQITYTRAGGESLYVTVVIDRNAPARDPEYPYNGRIFEVQIAHDPSENVGLSSEPKKGDKITVLNDPSDTASDCEVKQYIGVVSADRGGWLVQFG